MPKPAKVRRLIPDARLPDRYRVTSMTITRWRTDPKLNFPPAYEINGRRYRDEDELEAWEESRRENSEAE